MRASSHSSLVAEKYGSGTSPVRARTSSAGSSAQRSAVRRSCQTIAGATGVPVARCQRTVVSRWFAIPIACSSDGRTPADCDGVLGGGEHGRPELLRVVLDPPRPRVVLRKLRVAAAARAELVVHDETGGARRPLVDREDHDASSDSTPPPHLVRVPPGDRQRRPPAQDVLCAQRPLALARVEHLRLDLREPVAERLERARGDHLLRERAVRAGEVRGEQRVELRMPPPESIGCDVGVRGARQRLAAGGRSGAVRARRGARAAPPGRCDGTSSASRRRPRPFRAGRRTASSRGPPAPSRPLPPAGPARRRSARARSPERIGVEGEPGLVEDLPLLGVGRLDRAGVPLEGGVRRPEQEHPLPREPRTRRASGRSGSSARRPSRRCARARGARPCSGSPRCPPRASSSRRTSSIHGPAAFTTARLRTSTVSPESVSRTCATGPRSRPTSSTPLSTTPPASAAPRRFARQSRASSVWASG